MSNRKEESKRIKKFRLSIIKNIPRFPNNKDSLLALEKESLSSLLVHYTNWAIRYVSVRPREVHIESTASNDSRWKTFNKEIDSFLLKVRNGEDLTPHLSLQPHTRGYTPEASKIGPNVDRWADKDFLINVMGYHHFHLSSNVEKKGFVSRADEILFAKVTREKFNVIAITDHTVFNNMGSENKMPNERERLWNIFHEHSIRDVDSGSVIVNSSITTSGHSLGLVRLALDYAKIIHTIDPQLDDKSYVRDMCQFAGINLDKNPKLFWNLYFLDFGLVETNSKTFLVFRYGPN